MSAVSSSATLATSRRSHTVQKTSQHCTQDPCTPMNSGAMMQMTSAKCMQAAAPLSLCQRPHANPFAPTVRSNKNSLVRCQREQAVTCRANNNVNLQQKWGPAALSSTAMWLLSQLPAQAEGTDFSQGSFSKESYYVTLGLFLLSVPGVFQYDGSGLCLL